MANMGIAELSVAKEESSEYKLMLFLDAKLKRRHMVRVPCLEP